ncbi:MAG: sigma-70 family RNA polymerase sigma factor [Bacteroidota bacterium]
MGETNGISSRALHILNPAKNAEFEALLLKHLDSLYSVALRLTRSQNDAEDLVQETSLRALKSHEHQPQIDNPKSWLLTILFNVFKNAYKRKRKKPFVDIDLTEELLESASTVSYDQEAVFSQLMDDEVHQALDSLPIEFQSVIILSDLEECSHREISEILGCPAGTVASRLFRGRQLLRESLEAYAKRRRLL